MPNENEKIWQGDEARPLQIRRPCECGCDMRDRTSGAGYITGSDARGNGFTIWIEDEEVFLRAESMFRAHRLTT